MKAIIDGKMYNTETAVKIYSFRRKVNKGDILWMPGYCYTPFHVFHVYKTKNGAYFEHDTEDNKITVTSEENVREIMSRLDPDKYMEVFNIAVEEA